VVFNQFACPDCNMKYIRQTGRPFLVRFKVHFVILNMKMENQNLHHNTYYRTDIPLVLWRILWKSSR